MKNKKAIALVDAAIKYRRSMLEFVESAPVAQQDYDDLVSIAQMIENNESKESIAKAMWNLDTLVRDVIPDSVYSTYNR
jgi:hypothetical protein